MADAKAAVVESEADIDTGAESAEATPAKKRRFALPSLKMLIIVGGAVLLVAGGGAGAYFYFFAGHPEPKADAAATTAKAVVFVDMPEMTVNLSNIGAGRTQYLRVKIVLELPDKKMVDEIQPIMPRVMDAFQTYLRELRPSDLDGSAGLYRLKEELTRRVNASVAPGKINAVLFKEIVVQ
jgi:flagellar FliL protein